MLRGCLKKTVYLKNTGSKIFDEAYFLISERAASSGISSDDMIAEAGRIIDECTIGKRKRIGKGLPFGARFRTAIISFLIGGALGSTVSAVIIALQ